MSHERLPKLTDGVRSPEIKKLDAMIQGPIHGINGRNTQPFYILNKIKLKHSKTKDQLDIIGIPS